MTATYTLRVPGAQLHYEVRGDGPLLLVMGAPMDAGAFAPLAGALAGDYTVVTHDPRGITNSTLDDPEQDSTPELRADDVAAVLDALGADSADVFGTSGGAVTGLALVTQHPGRVRTLAVLYPNRMHVVTIEGTGIETMEDLAGQRINLGPPGSNAAVLAQRLLEAYGVFDPGNAQFLSYAEGTSAMINGNLDATVVLAGAPTAALIDLGAQREMKLLAVDAEIVAGMLDEYPFYQLYDIPAETYSGQSEPVTVINDPATLFAKADADEDLIYSITKTLFDNLDELGEIHPQAAAIALETGPNTPIDLHPGAQRYFDEAGQ
jgi:TRAP transporter TAXI family solute receptor